MCVCMHVCVGGGVVSCSVPASAYEGLGMRLCMFVGVREEEAGGEYLCILGHMHILTSIFDVLRYSLAISSECTTCIGRVIFQKFLK